jgi:hypothetical protein
VKSRRDGGSDIHDVSGNGNRKAASTESQPRNNGSELIVPLRFVNAVMSGFDKLVLLAGQRRRIKYQIINA